MRIFISVGHFYYVDGKGSAETGWSHAKSTLTTDQSSLISKKKGICLVSKTRNLRNFACDFKSDMH